MMRTTGLAGILLIGVVGACGDPSQRAAQPSAATGSASARSIAGRWALDSIVINGKDLTAEMKASGSVAYYTLTRDGNFRITRGDSLAETGTWSEDTTASPMIFDHIPNYKGKPGQLVPGIFAITGDTLRVAIAGPRSVRHRPTQFASALADSTWLLVYHRVPE